MPIKHRYWDAATFLGWLNGEQEKVKVSKGVISEGESGSLKIVTSAFTIAEVIYLKGHPKITVDKKEMVCRFFENDYIVTVAVDRFVAESARELLWQHKALKPKDAIHVATALYKNIQIFDTFDEGLIRLNGKIGNPPLQIGKPDLPYQTELPFETENTTK